MSPSPGVGFWQEIYDRYNNTIDYPIYVDRIDLVSTTPSVLNTEFFLVAWSGIFCYDQTYPSDFMAIDILVSNSQDIVSLNSSVLSEFIQFTFSPQSLQKTELLLLSQSVPKYSKTICGSVQIFYKHSGGSAGCVIRFGDWETSFQNTVVYSKTPHLLGSPFSVSVLPGQSKLFTRNLSSEPIHLNHESYLQVLHLEHMPLVRD